MSKPVTLKIDEVEYVRADSVKQTIPEGDIKIVILQRGWVMVGYLSKSGTQYFLKKTSVIRNWGTTKGLGQLVGGPTDATKLEPTGTVEFHELTVVAIINCEEDGWRNKL